MSDFLVKNGLKCFVVRVLEGEPFWGLEPQTYSFSNNGWIYRFTPTNRNYR